MPPAASFLSAAKEKRKRNAAKNYVFGFPYAASPDFSLVEISHANVVPWKLHRNIALSLLLKSAAAFALKCRRTSFYRGRNQRQRRGRGDSPFDRTTKLNSRDRVVQAADNNGT